MTEKIAMPDPKRRFTQDDLGKSFGKKTDSAAALKNIAPPSMPVPPVKQSQKKTP